MIRVAGSYFDGRSARSRPVELLFHSDGRLEILGEDLQLAYPKAVVEIDPPLGYTHRFVRLPDDARCEVVDHDVLELALSDWGRPAAGQWVHHLEKSGPLVLLAVAVLTLFGWLLYSYALPWGARQVAFALPAGLATRLGTDTLTVLDKTVFKPSTLPATRQAALQAAFDAFLHRTRDRTAYHIVFRHSEAIGANAFALPSGDIVITDGLVELAKDDQELVAVLAHECGHVVRRHALRSVLQNSAIFVVMALVTGDVSSATAFGSALPAYLMESKFSREFETEADLHAVHLMQEAAVDPNFLATVLGRLSSQAHESKHATLSYLSSHPPTEERISAIKGAAHPISTER